MKTIRANTPRLSYGFKALFCFAFFLISPFCLMCNAAIITVPDDHSTIQAAIDAASDGDEIIVSPGTYYENINVNGKDIILRSTAPTSSTVVAATIIDGRSSDSVVKFSGTESPSCVLTGFTITNGYAASFGGGVYGNGTRATVQNNIILANRSGHYGGGVSWCSGAIKNNVISYNSAGYQGGGLHDCDGIIQNNGISNNGAHQGGGLHSCDGTIQNNIISYNSASYSGGGLYMCMGTVQNNIISGNSTYMDGGGLWRCEGPILYNTISGNSAYWGAGGLYYCTGPIINCIIWANSASQASQLYGCSTPFYSCIQDWTGKGRGDISADPKFVDSDNGNFHLKPDSPCIDAGNIYYLFGNYIADMDAECRLAGGSVDMGSDEYASSLDRDGDLLSDIEEHSRGSNPNEPDTDGDGLIDGAEILRGTDPNSSDAPSGITIPLTYPSIQQGLFLSFPSESIMVQQGCYHENLHFLGKNVILRSMDPLDDEVTSSTVINGDELFSVITFKGTENKNCIVTGLTIRNGAAYCGGGICGNGALATIENSKIVGNSAQGGGGINGCNGIIRTSVISSNSAYGGGGGLFECSGIISDSIISDNLSSWGGGLSFCNGIIRNNIISNSVASTQGGGGLHRCNGMIESNLIYGNRANNEAGGLDWCNATIQNNLIAFNYAGNRGGGLYYCNGIIQNNTIWANSGNERAGGLMYCGNIIKNCIIGQNTASSDTQLSNCATPSYSCIQDWTGGGEGNISDDPQLVDPENGDFHLLPSSPCIDAGGYVEGLTEDFEGDPRPMDGTSEPRGDGSDYDIGADEFPGIFKVQEYNFELTNEGWSSVTLPAYFTPPDCYYLPGYIVLTALDNTHTYGFWTSEPNAVPVIADCLYRARWTVATDVTDPMRVPHMQLRINSQNFQQADVLAVSSAGDGSYAPTPEGRTYDMYFVPPESCLGKPEDQDDLMLSFDILNFDPEDAPDGSLMLDSVVVEAIPLDTLSTPGVVKTWSFDAGAEGWEFGSAPLFFSSPVSGVSGGALWLIAENNTNTFGYWSGPSDEVHAEEGKLYRVRFGVSTNVVNQEEVAQLRLRVSSEDFQASMVKVISSVTGGEMSPSPAVHTYEVYFYPPQSLVGTEADSITAAFDMLNFDPADAPNGSLMLDSVIVESLDIP